MTDERQPHGAGNTTGLNSYRNILRGILLIGGSTVISLLFGLLRNKLLAVFGGPVSVGLVGLLSNAMGVISSAGGLGLGMAGVREITAAGRERLPAVRASLRLYAILLSMICLGFVFAFTDVIGGALLDGKVEASTIAWLGFGASATILAIALETELRALHRVRAIATSNVLSSAAATAAVAVWMWSADTSVELAFVLIPLLSMLLMHLWFVTRLPPIDYSALSRISDLVRPWRGFIAIGVPVMLAATLTVVVALVLRLIIEDRAGLGTLGLFVGVHLLSANYLGFILKAMGTDYFPRLSATIGSRGETLEMINRQTRVLLILGLPVLLAVYGLSELVITVIYTAEFATASRLLQLYVLGDFLKIIAWPLGFWILAAGRSMLFWLTESLANFVLLGMVYFFFEGDLDVVGLAYIVMRIAHTLMIYLLAGRLIRFRLSSFNIAYFFLFAALVLLVHASSEYSVNAGRIVTCIVVAVLAGSAYLNVRTMLSSEKSGRPEQDE